MNYEKNYKKNLEALNVIDKLLYAELLDMQNILNFEACALDGGMDILDKRRNIFLYNGDAKNFVLNKFKDFNTKYGLYPYTYHFGMGTGAYYKKL